jgi:hypothetical protein
VPVAISVSLLLPTVFITTMRQSAVQVEGMTEHGWR